MMVIKHTHAAGAHPRDAVGARQNVLIWEYGVVTGRVAAVQVLECGGADLVIEFEVPQPVMVPDDICARVQACRFSEHCPWLSQCELHEHGPDCGGCQ